MAAGKRIRLNIFERTAIPEILPKEARKDVGRLCVNIRQKIRLTKSDDKKYKILYFQLPDGRVQLRYDERLDKGQEFFLTPAEWNLIAGNLKIIEGRGNLPTLVNWHNLYDRFVGKGKSEAQKDASRPQHKTG